MVRVIPIVMTLGFLISVNFACTHNPGAKLTMTEESIAAGSSVARGSEQFALYPGELKIGDSLTAALAELGYKVDAVTVINIVPSVDTKVCEAQSHILGETKRLHPAVKRVSISRDLPFAQHRFAEEAELQNITYLSDYRYGAFGKKTGLLIKDLELLTRGVIVVDAQGVIRYLQFVPQLATLPDMEKAFKVANQLVDGQS